MTDTDHSIRPGDSGEPTVPRRRVVVSCLAIMSVAAAIIHFVVAGQHFQEYWLFGVFMLTAAWSQLAWAIAAVARPSLPLLWGGALLNSAVVTVYIITRTVGDVVGPTPRAVERAGFGDVLCTLLEAAVIAGCAWLLIARTDRQVQRTQLVKASTATSGVTAILLSTALLAGGPQLVMSASASPATGAATAMHMPGVTAPSLRLVTRSPGGDITMPEPAMQMAPGMAMASSAACRATPTKQQQRAAVALVDASWRGASKYRSLAFARASGYRPITPVGLPVVHYLNLSYYLATFMGGPVLNTAAPQSLVYANTPRGAVLVAAMYITTPGGQTPQPGGCLTRWHVHTNLCLSRGLGVVAVVTAAHPNCPPGSLNRVTPPMMHVWFVPIPGGPTAVDAPDAQVVRAAERVAPAGNGPA